MTPIMRGHRSMSQQVVLLLLFCLFWKKCFFLYFYVKHITFWNCLCSSSSRDSVNVIRNIGEFGAKNYFTEHRTANKIHGFRYSVSVLKYTAVIRIRKCLSNFPFLSKWWKARTVCRFEQPTSNRFQTFPTVCTYSNYMIN